MEFCMRSKKGQELIPSPFSGAKYVQKFLFCDPSTDHF